MDHWRVAPGNSDASLSYFGIGNDADDRRASNGRDGCSGSVFRQLSTTSCGPSLRTTYRNRYSPDRSGCRSLPGGDNGHSCRDGHCSPSVAKADENWNKRNNGYIIIQARALHGWGCGIGGLVKVETRCRTCLNGPLSLPDSFLGVTSRGWSADQQRPSSTSPSDQQGSPTMCGFWQPSTPSSPSTPYSSR